MFPDLRTKALYLFIFLIFIGHVWFVIYNFQGHLAPGQDPKSVIPLRYGLLVWIPFLLTIPIRYFRLRQLENAAWKEDLAEGATEESQIARDLTEEEKAFLLAKKGDNNAYIDSQSPVFKIQGAAFVEELYSTKHQGGQTNHHYALHLRKMTFTGDDIDNFNGITGFNGKEIVVEYSPKTKHIWKISKV